MVGVGLAIDEATNRCAAETGTGTLHEVVRARGPGRVLRPDEH